MASSEKTQQFQPNWRVKSSSVRKAVGCDVVEQCDVLDASSFVSLSKGPPVAEMAGDGRAPPPVPADCRSFRAPKSRFSSSPLSTLRVSRCNWPVHPLQEPLAEWG